MNVLALGSVDARVDCRGPRRASRDSLASASPAGRCKFGFCSGNGANCAQRSLGSLLRGTRPNGEGAPVFQRRDPSPENPRRLFLVASRRCCSAKRKTTSAWVLGAWVSTFAHARTGCAAVVVILSALVRTRAPEPQAPRSPSRIVVSRFARLARIRLDSRPVPLLARSANTTSARALGAWGSALAHERTGCARVVVILSALVRTRAPEPQAPRCPSRTVVSRFVRLARLSLYSRPMPLLARSANTASFRVARARVSALGIRPRRAVPPNLTACQRNWQAVFVTSEDPVPWSWIVACCPLGLVPCALSGSSLSPSASWSVLARASRPRSRFRRPIRR